jgi:uncharacterized RmlC-like cupin family protein
MKTLKITPDQMRSRIARWSKRKVHMNHTVETSIPAEAFDAVNPPLYLLLAHAAEDAHEDSRPAITGEKGMLVAILDIPPGKKAPLHVHRRSREAFLCLKGRVKLRWNEHGADETILEPLDMIDVPVGVYRDFQCVGDEPALLLAMIRDEREDEPGDVVIAAEERARFAERFGDAILEKLTASTGLHFTDPPGK